MKKVIGVTLVLIILGIVVPKIMVIGKIKKHISKTEYHDGDIIFQASNSRQCEAVKMATHSDISHCGLLFQEEGRWYVLEAVEPVQVISLSEFIRRGTGQHYKIKRLKDSYPLSNDVKKAMTTLGKKWIGKHYDIYFNWSGEELYCSELVWKLYSQIAHIDLCALRPLKEYDLKDNLVGEMMRERYGSKIPYDEKMVAPSDIFASDKLELVDEK
jgi:hypothetical protein